MTASSQPPTDYHPDPDSPEAYEAALDKAWTSFRAAFPTEEDCVEELYKRLANRANDCCGSPDLIRARGTRKAKCQHCQKELWFTARTFFHHARAPRAWLAAIWFLEHGVSISSFRFHQLLGIAYSSALHIFKRVTMVAAYHLEGEATPMSSAFFSELFGKRSRETPAREPPVAEQNAVETSEVAESHRSLHVAAQRGCSSTRSLEPEDRSGRQDYENSAQFAELPSLTETAHTAGNQTDRGLERTLSQLLSSGPITFDDLCATVGVSAAEMASTLMIMELDGVVARLPGDRYVLSKRARISGGTIAAGIDKPDPSGVSWLVMHHFIASCALRFHRISRKYLQNYLAAHWCTVNTARWAGGTLLDACTRFRTITDDELLAYISPRWVYISSSMDSPIQGRLTS